MRVLSTLARPTSGQASVLGHNVVAAPLDVRRRISVVIQETAVELFLSVRGNLGTFARFHGLRDAEIRTRVDRVLADFGLGPEAHRKVQDLSGGFRRRVQVAKIFMVDTPRVSTSVRPAWIRSSSVMEKLRREAAGGRTIVLTTQIQRPFSVPISPCPLRQRLSGSIPCSCWAPASAVRPRARSA